MPHLNAEALTEDPDGLGFLHAVLDQGASAQALGRRLVPTIQSRLTPPATITRRDAEYLAASGSVQPEIATLCEAAEDFAYSI